MNPRSNTAALLLSLIPGLGHFYLYRYFRAFLYGAGFFGPLGLLFLLAISNNIDEEIALLMLFVAGVVWIINLIDMFVTLGHRRPTGQPGYSTDYIPHSAEGYGHVSGPDAHGPIGPEMANGPVGPASRYHPGAYEWQRKQERRRIMLASFIPGLGHYQLGLMYRGLSAMIFFVGAAILIFFAGSLTHMEEFFFFILGLPVLWIYIIFDALRQLEKKQEGYELIDRSFFDDFHESRHEGRRSKTIATILAVFPGAAHLYLGLQTRGLQLMAGFLFSIYIMDVLRLSLFLFLIPIFWFYSFFDALQYISKQDYEFLDDRPLFKGLKRHQRKIGFLIIIVGIYYLTNEVLLDVLHKYFPSHDWPYSLSSYFQTFIVAMILIGGGLTLLFNRPDR
ncbi:hypothetical protein [Paenibacillus lutrae]|uniref:Multi-tm2 domain protein n=1 Tax=Paenibacillus lutrae TaxID=2078573 RepID=A0A7X3FMJ2_9BACL|nr:hypothetical protein [Paenibacillus lutrae]MVP02480.1 hypothetical protein [Paenibacillus lutrae]